MTTYSYGVATGTSERTYEVEYFDTCGRFHTTHIVTSTPTKLPFILNQKGKFKHINRYRTISPEKGEWQKWS